MHPPRVQRAMDFLAIVGTVSLFLLVHYHNFPKGSSSVACCPRRFFFTHQSGLSPIAPLRTVGDALLFCFEEALISFN